MQTWELAYGELHAGDIFYEDGNKFKKVDDRRALFICDSAGNPPSKEQLLIFYPDSKVQVQSDPS